MSNCNDLFGKFHDSIKLTKTKNDDLMNARDGIRTRIKNYFKKTLEQSPPDFKMQGSFKMRTSLNPLSGEFDVDDGVYLNNLSDSMDDWQTPSSVHKWIYDAVSGHTKEKPKDKRTCVRVTYAGNYHVDLPIYAQNDSKIYLAEKGDNGWVESDPVKFKDWFVTQVQNDEQLRRIVRYIKAWADYESRNGLMPKSIILTVLATNAYETYDGDDACFSVVLNSIYERISCSFEVLNPVDTSEDLACRMTESQKNRFLERISAFAQDSIEALQEDCKEDACKIWYRYFGDRFPSCEGLSENDKALKTAAPAILKDDARSAIHEIK